MCQDKEKLGQGSHLIRYCENQILLSMMLEGKKSKPKKPYRERV